MRQTKIIEIVPGISISISQKHDLIVTGEDNSVDYPKRWETSFEDDHFAVYKYPITLPDSLTQDSKKQTFKKNINAFIRTFDFKNIDTTYQFGGTIFQSDINFEYIFEGDRYKFIGKFLEYNDNFIAFCFQTPFPVDKYSLRIKDQVFSSIIIK